MSKGAGGGGWPGGDGGAGRALVSGTKRFRNE